MGVIQFADTAEETVDAGFLLGPVAGPIAPASATKSEHLTLPSDALLPDIYAPVGAPLPSATAHAGVEKQLNGIVGGPISSAAARVLAKAPSPGQHPGRKHAAAPAAGGPTGLIKRPDGLAPNLAPRSAAASRQPSGSVAAPPQAPAPGAELVAWARQWEKPGQSVRSESIGLPPASRSAAPAPSVGYNHALLVPPAPLPSAGRIAIAPSATPTPNVQVPILVTTPVAAPAIMTPKRTAILYTNDGV